MASGISNGIQILSLLCLLNLTNTDQNGCDVTFGKKLVSLTSYSSGNCSSLVKKDQNGIKGI